jgi:hypothetical protein
MRIDICSPAGGAKGKIMRVLVLAACSTFAVSATALMLACATPNIPDDALGDENGTEPPTKTTPPVKHDAGRGTRPEPTPDAGTTNPDPQPQPQPNPASDAGTTTNACATSATKATCYQCCETANPTALPFLDNEWGKCVCEVPGVCANACANSYCVGGAVAPGSNCDACLSANDQACGAQADNKCAADATCKKLFQCDSDSKCTTKP